MQTDSKSVIKDLIETTEKTRDMLVEELNRQRDKLTDKDGKIAEALLSAQRITLDRIEKSQKDEELSVFQELEKKENELKNLIEKFSTKG